MEGSTKHETLNQEAGISFACTKKVIFTDKWHYDRGNSTTTGRVLFDVNVGWFSERELDQVKREVFCVFFRSKSTILQSVSLASGNRSLNAWTNLPSRFRRMRWGVA